MKRIDGQDAPSPAFYAATQGQMSTNCLDFATPGSVRKSPLNSLFLWELAGFEFNGMKIRSVRTPYPVEPSAFDVSFLHRSIAGAAQTGCYKRKLAFGGFVLKHIAQFDFRKQHGLSLLY
jgi:hypothetical protein